MGCFKKIYWKLKERYPTFPIFEDLCKYWREKIQVECNESFAKDDLNSFNSESILAPSNGRMFSRSKKKAIKQFKLWYQVKLFPNTKYNIQYRKLDQEYFKIHRTCLNWNHWKYFVNKTYQNNLSNWKNFYLRNIMLKIILNSQQLIWYHVKKFMINAILQHQNE